MHSTLRASLGHAETRSNSVYDSCRVWLDALRAKAIPGTKGTVPGIYLDAIFQNTFIDDHGCRFIDLEWEWHEPLPLSVLVIRATRPSSVSNNMAAKMAKPARSKLPSIAATMA